jgi:hypothetical protein
LRRADLSASAGADYATCLTWATEGNGMSMTYLKKTKDTRSASDWEEAHRHTASINDQRYERLHSESIYTGEKLKVSM